MVDGKIENIYKITKGLCLIINIINFDGNEEFKREGSEENVKLIKEAFEYHGFEVMVETDLNDNEIINLIDEQVNREKCKLFDAFVLYIYSHGIADSILCSNNKTIKFYEIIEIFQDEICENLSNKPKIIFFDCCRTGDIILHIIYYILTQINLFNCRRYSNGHVII